MDERTARIQARFEGLASRYSNHGLKPYVPFFQKNGAVAINFLPRKKAAPSPRQSTWDTDNAEAEEQGKARIQEDQHEQEENVEEIEGGKDKFDTLFPNFSGEFTRNQLAPLLSLRKERSYDLDEFPMYMSNHSVGNDFKEALLKLSAIDSLQEPFAVIEVPLHTSVNFLPGRIRFDLKFNSYFYVLNKEEFLLFEKKMSSLMTGIIFHEVGPIGIGKTMLCYSYGNLLRLYIFIPLIYHDFSSRLHKIQMFTGF